MSHEVELQTALSAVSRAVNLCRSVWNNREIIEHVHKEDRSPATVADFGSQAVITHVLRDAFPGDAIVAEEDSSPLRSNPHLKRSVLELVCEQIGSVPVNHLLRCIDAGQADTDFGGRFWTIDPIDGTKGFLRGEQYAVALALVESGVVTLGVLGCPNFAMATDDEASAGATVYALRGGGCWRVQPRRNRRVNASPLRDLSRAKFCESVESAHADHEVHARIASLLGISEPPLRMDSQAKYAAVAGGQAAIYLRLPRDEQYQEKIWDHAAGSIIVEEAGGEVTDVDGRPLDFSVSRNLLNNRGVVATNGPIDRRVLDAVGAALHG